MTLTLWVALLGGFSIAQIGIIFFLADRVLKAREAIAGTRAEIESVRSLVLEKDHETERSLNGINGRLNKIDAGGHRYINGIF